MASATLLPVRQEPHLYDPGVLMHWTGGFEEHGELTHSSTSLVQAGFDADTLVHPL